MSRSILLYVLLYVALTSAQDILTVLSAQAQLTTFTNYIKQYPDLVDRLNGGSYTVAAPDNEAFTALAESGSANISDIAAVKALLEYHLLHSIYASASFSQGPTFVPTLLTNESYANVTGGQRVEIGTRNGTPVLISAIKAISQVTTRDILFVGGIIQVVDKVLSIPLPLPETITAAGLTDLVALLGVGGWLNPTAGVLGLVTEPSDFTAFAPNDPRYSANYQGWDGKSTEDLLKIFKYGLVVGEVLYSPLLLNNSHFKSTEGAPLTITDSGHGKYVDDSQIAVTNYLLSNGVLHTVHSPLNPNTSDARPSIAATINPQSSHHHSLSHGAIAAIAVVLTLLFIGACLAALFFFLRRRRRNAAAAQPTRADSRRGSKKLGELSELDSKYQGQKQRPVSTSVRELDGMNERIELEARERPPPRLPPKSPRHIGFQIQAGVGLTI